jgi:hypothetical protein
MKWENNKWTNFFFFLFGCLICYLTLQISLFDIKKELDVPGIIINALSLCVGIYIADSIQNKINKNQNTHTYLITKIDALWIKFNDFAAPLSYSTYVDAAVLRTYNKNLIHPLSFINHIYTSFEIDTSCLMDLENKLDALETNLSNLRADNNIIDFNQIQGVIENDILQINLCFTIILKNIQKI